MRKRMTAELLSAARRDQPDEIRREMKTALRVELRVFRLHAQRRVAISGRARCTREIFVPAFAAERADRGPGGGDAVRLEQIEECGHRFAAALQVGAITGEIEAVDV